MYRSLYTNLCLTRVKPRYVNLQECTNSSEQLWDRQFTTSGRFELTPADPTEFDERVCMTQQHHPRESEILGMRNCETAHRDTTGYWVALERDPDAVSPTTRPPSPPIAPIGFVTDFPTPPLSTPAPTILAPTRSPVDGTSMPTTDGQSDVITREPSNQPPPDAMRTEQPVSDPTPAPTPSDQDQPDSTEEPTDNKQDQGAPDPVLDDNNSEPTEPPTEEPQVANNGDQDTPEPTRQSDASPTDRPRAGGNNNDNNDNTNNRNRVKAPTNEPTAEKKGGDNFMDTDRNQSPTDGPLIQDTNKEDNDNKDQFITDGDSDQPNDDNGDDNNQDDNAWTKQEPADTTDQQAPATNTNNPDQTGDNDGDTNNPDDTVWTKQDEPGDTPAQQTPTTNTNNNNKRNWNPGTDAPTSFIFGSTNQNPYNDRNNNKDVAVGGNNKNKA